MRCQTLAYKRRSAHVRLLPKSVALLQLPDLSWDCAKDSKQGLKPEVEITFDGQLT